MALLFVLFCFVFYYRLLRCKFDIISGWGMWFQKFDGVSFALWGFGLWDSVERLSPRLSDSFSWLFGWWIGDRLSLTVSSRETQQRMRWTCLRALSWTRSALLMEAGESLAPYFTPVSGMCVLLSSWCCGLREFVLWPPDQPATPPPQKERKVARGGWQALQVYILHDPIPRGSRVLPCPEWRERGATTSPAADSEGGQGAQAEAQKDWVNSSLSRTSGW